MYTFLQIYNSSNIIKSYREDMCKYLTKYQVLHPAQSRFRPGHSCQTALINIVDQWLQQIDNGNFNVAVFIDLKKAFDVVDHNILCKKHEVYGYKDTSLAFCKSYLNERTQQVQIGNVQ